MAWTPILEGSDAARARAFVAAACAELSTRTVPEPSLGDGQAGIALLHGARARAGEAGAEEQAFAALEVALAAISTEPAPWLFVGYAGIGFALHQLQDLVGDVAEPLAHIDELVRRTVAGRRWPQAWELGAGWIGLGVYGLERGLPGLVEGVVDQLAAGAERTAGGATWRTFEPADDTVGHFNLGIAHGVAGAVTFLAEACDRAPRAAPLLRDAVRWLRACERADPASAYPMTIGRGFESTQVLDGWCYGDPSTALALVRAGQALADASLVEAGHALARRAARRSEADLARFIVDESLCHGDIGHAHLYHRLGLLLADAELLDAARGWYRRALDRTVLADARTGLQVGLAGAALGMLAGYSADEPAWDRAFLLGRS